MINESLRVSEIFPLDKPPR